MPPASAVSKSSAAGWAGECLLRAHISHTSSLEQPRRDTNARLRRALFSPAQSQGVRRIFASHFSLAIVRTIDDAVLHKLSKRMWIRENHTAAGAVIQPIDDDELACLARMDTDTLEMVGMTVWAVEVMDEIFGLHGLYINTASGHAPEDC